MSPDIADDEQQIQEDQYDYPYHYIPRVENGQFSQSQYWSWGMHYLGGIQLILEQIDSYSFDSLIDVGCGDGRFLRELARNTHLSILWVSIIQSGLLRWPGE